MSQQAISPAFGIVIEYSLSEVNWKAGLNLINKKNKPAMHF